MSHPTTREELADQLAQDEEFAALSEEEQKSLFDSMVSEITQTVDNEAAGTLEKQFLKGLVTPGSIVHKKIKSDVVPAMVPDIDSTASKILFQGAPGLAGTVLSGGNVGVGMLSAAGGESIRHGIRNLVGKTPATLPQEVSDLLGAATAEGVGAVAPAVIRPIAKGIGNTVQGLQSLMTGVSEKAFARLNERGAEKVLNRSVLRNPAAAIESVARKTITGMNKIREVSEKSYGTAIDSIKPILRNSKVDLSGTISNFRTKLIQSGVIKPSGEVVKPLTDDFAETVLKSRKALKAELDSLIRMNTDESIGGGMLSKPKVVTASDAVSYKRALDNKLEFGKAGVNEISSEAQGLLQTLRSNLKTITETKVPQLKRINEGYESFRSSYDDMVPKLKEGNVQDTLRRLENSRNTANYNRIRDLESALPVKDRFLDEALDVLAGEEFSALFPKGGIRRSLAGAAGFHALTSGGMVPATAALGAASSPRLTAELYQAAGSPLISKPFSMLGRLATSPITTSSLVRTLGSADENVSE
ncbi:hypothetical protein [Caudoviricetes sp.]|nr:hypothetical protein [Caudoviricetes sp.]UOF80999.1 hypothetical protein [Caudoviricetes sp.]UOF81395.1 hypothetical protein [Caudoviricetes sp.]